MATLLSSDNLPPRSASGQAQPPPILAFPDPTRFSVAIRLQSREPLGPTSAYFLIHTDAHPGPEAVDLALHIQQKLSSLPVLSCDDVEPVIAFDELKRWIAF